MSNLESQSSRSVRKFGLPFVALVVSFVSLPVGAVLGVFALKQMANRQADPAIKKLALVGMIALSAFALVYAAVAVFLISTGYDLFP